MGPEYTVSESSGTPSIVASADQQPTKTSPFPSPSPGGFMKALVSAHSERTRTLPEIVCAKAWQPSATTSTAASPHTRGA